jgi:methyltransferase (TIGR00027 family)
MANKRIANKASRTAAYNCFSRACATREKDPRFRGPDTLAEVILPPFPRWMLDFVPLRKYLMHRMFPPGIYEYVYARTKVFDAAFLRALEEHFSQIVLLGAGFDTRALRFADHNQGTKIFELDAPTTQSPKLRIFRKKKIAIPSELIFASIDFDTQDIFTILSQAGYQDGAQTLFLWEEVCMYLTAQAVDDTLNFVHTHASPASQIIFDYIYASVIRQENRYYGEQGIFATVAQTGEDWTFGLEEGEIEPFLAAHGFEMLAHYTPIELEHHYLTAEDGTLHGRVNGTHCIVLAGVK